MEAKEKFIIEVCQLKEYYQDIAADCKGIFHTAEKQLAKIYDSYGDAKNAAMEVLPPVGFKAFAIDKIFVFEQPVTAA